MFLAVPEALVQANLDRILIPRFAFVGYFSGEVRAKDVFAQDHYAAQYLQKYTPEPEFKDHQTHLVSTLAKSATRPGVGGAAFFSNGACRQSERWFDLFPNFLGGFYLDQDGNVMRARSGGGAFGKAEEHFRQSSLLASVDITGRMIRDRCAALFPDGEPTKWPTDKVTLQSTPGGPFEAQLLIPVEWCYDTLARPERSANSQPCLCMTRCWTLPPEQRNQVDFLQPTSERPATKMPVWTEIEANADLKAPTVGRIGAYLQQWPGFEGIAVKSDKALRRKRKKAEAGAADGDGDENTGVLEGWVAATGSSGAGATAMETDP
jgi:hypothetical protein